MLRCTGKLLLVVSGSVGVAALAATPARGQSTGCMRMPSTWAQYVGCGYGAGHHAPIVRTPLQRPPRVPRMVIVSACEGPLCPAAYEPIGCYGGGCYMQYTDEYLAPQPALPAPVAAPPGAPSPQPMTPAVGQRPAWRTLTL